MSEINGNGNTLNKPGLYTHKESGKTVELDGTPDVGTPIIDAFIQAGYVYTGVVPEAKAEVVSPVKAK